MSAPDKKPKLGKILTAMVGMIVLIGVIAYSGGLFDSGKIEPGLNQPPDSRIKPPARTGQADLRTIVEWYEAVGTVRPKTETNIESQVTARVLDVLVRPGAMVKKDQKLIQLDDRQLQSALQRAIQGLRSATAGRDQALQSISAAQAEYTRLSADYDRMKQLYKSRTSSKRDLDRAESAYIGARSDLSRAKEGLTAAEAGVSQAKKLIEEARIALGHTVIEAPEDGQVVQRLIEPGDLALPGKPLITLQTSGSLRLEALVREGLIHLISPGDKLTVYISALDKALPGLVEEVVPSADPLTRTFLVKAAVPSQKGLYPGMFGRLRLPVGKKEILTAPEAAIKKTGQLETVLVKTDSGWKRRYVKTGRRLGDRIEILSGLSGGEILGWDDHA